MDLVQTLTGFAILAGFFWLLELIWPERRRQPKWRRDSLTDLIYWFIIVPVTKFISNIVILIGVIFTALFLPRLSPTIISQQPDWLQVLEVLLIGDFIGYWTHRAFHYAPRLWRIHAVHHSPEQLDWLAAARVHPLNTIINDLLVIIPLYLLGFSNGVVAAYVPLLTLLGIGLHANLSWDFGPLRYIIASPAWHRWHHSSDTAALDKNFCGLFPFIDFIFGTAYFPKGQKPQNFGLNNEKMPRNFLAQLVYPFRSKKPAPGLTWEI